MWKKSKSAVSDGRGGLGGHFCSLSYEDLVALADEELLAHLNHSDADAVAILYQRYRRLVFGVAYRVLRDRGEAEDVVQNVFVDLYRTSLRFDPTRGTAKIWILQYAYSRSLRRRQQLICRHFYSAVDLAVVEDVLPAVRSTTDHVEHSHAVSQALRTLSGPQQHVIRLASEGHTLRAIASATGETLANVRHYYYRGLAKLRIHFGIMGQSPARPTKEAADATT